MKKVLVVVGARPNFIKISQFPRVFKKYRGDLQCKIVHTGQHYDDKMSTVFFKQLGIHPDFYLDVKPGTPATQMAQIMLGLESLLSTRYRADLVLVVGDVNSTLAGALTANKMNIPVGHVESGLRSFDRDMPEEFNRVLADQVCDLLFVTEKSGEANLLKEGKSRKQISFVGNTMIDTLVAFDKEIKRSDILDKLSLGGRPFVLMTMHRPSNVDTREGLRKLQDLIGFISRRYAVVFPIHPRTIARLREFRMERSFKSNKNLFFTEPLDYFAFQKLIISSSFIVTDSGGIQEESTFRKVPCLTLRPNTERPSTVSLGTNSLVPFELETIAEHIGRIESGKYKKGKIPPFWDGRSTERIVKTIRQFLR
ncbi:MAG: UDP-N-acetylglucosamine 2-epimerase (non-hydrolyzing) [Bacteroidota bacterium]